MRKTFVLLSAIAILVSCGADVSGLLKEAEIKNTAGKTADALELYTKAIDQNNNSIEAYKGRARVYSDQKTYNKAALDYIFAAILAENDSSRKSEAGDLYYSAGLNGYLAYGSCDYPKQYFQKACDLGSKDACANTCLNK